VGLRAGLDGFGIREKSLAPTGIRTADSPTRSLVTIHITLTWLLVCHVRYSSRHWASGHIG
jgi:hypothetical protein